MAAEWAPCGTLEERKEGPRGACADWSYPQDGFAVNVPGLSRRHRPRRARLRRRRTSRGSSATLGVVAPPRRPPQRRDQPRDTHRVYVRVEERKEPWGRVVRVRESAAMRNSPGDPRRESLRGFRRTLQDASGLGSQTGSRLSIGARR